MTAVCPSRTWTLGAEATAGGPLDLLFVIDDSASMADQEEWLRTELVRSIRLLATGDLDDDGTTDFGPHPSLHVGVLPARVADTSGRCGTSDDEAVIQWVAIGEAPLGDVAVSIEQVINEGRSSSA